MKQARTQGKKEERKERKKEGKKERNKERKKQRKKQRKKEKKKERKKERQAGREEKKKKMKGKKPKKLLPVSLGVSFPFSSFSTLLSMTLRFGFFDRYRNRIKFPTSPSVYTLSATQYFRFSFRFLNCHFDVNKLHACLINFTIFGHTFNKGGFFDRYRNRIKFPTSPSVYTLSATQYFRFSFRFLNCHFDVNKLHACLINFTIFGHTFNKGVKYLVLFITVIPLKEYWFNLYGSGVSSPFISCSH